MATTTTTSADPDLLTVSEAARLLRLSRTTVRRLAREGKLPAFQVGSQWRIDRHALPPAASARKD
jgi:excisionase family DNA binding protein